VACCMPHAYLLLLLLSVCISSTGMATVTIAMSVINAGSDLGFLVFSLLQR
jgi:hypothetical protein